MSISSDLRAAAAAVQDQTVEWRRTIHAEPELGLELPKTQATVLEGLTGLGLDITTGESTTSVVADLGAGRPGPVTLLRADMDALPLQEDAEVTWASRHDGRMHACGHDSHTAMLLAAARLLADNQDQLAGPVRFMFQPGEEGYHGARYMIEEGLLDGVDRAFAIHISSSSPAGVFGTRAGALLASSDEFTIDVHGSGGHASMPNDCVDPIPAAAATVLGLHTMVGRVKAGTDPAVLTVASMTAGTTTNIIPPDATLQGTLRTHDETTRSRIRGEIERVAEHTAAAHGCTCSVGMTSGYPVTVNHAGETERAVSTVFDVFGADDYHPLSDPIMAAEDFSYVLNQVPGSMMMLGLAPKDRPLSEAAPNHSNLMTIDEDAMASGVALYAAMALAT